MNKLPETTLGFWLSNSAAILLLGLWLGGPARADVAMNARMPASSAGQDEAPESSPSSPPLATDDPGTPGRGGYEINVIASCDHARSDRACAAGIDAAFGIGDNAQLRISKSGAWERIAGQTPLNGVGPTDVGVKYRFYEDLHWRVATFPSLDLDDGARRFLTDRTPIEREGRSLYLPLIVSRVVATAAGDVTAVANIGRRFNFRSSGNDSSFFAFALGKAVTATSRMMAEVTAGCDANWAACRKDVRIGFVSRLPALVPAPYEISLFASAGIGRDGDGQLHRTVLVGISSARASERQ